MRLKLAILCLLSSFMLSGAAFAENVLTVDYNREESTVDVSGSSDKEGIARLLVLKPGTDVLNLTDAQIWANTVYADEVSIESSDFGFETFSMPSDLSEGGYIIRVALVDEVFEKTIEYATVSRATELLLGAENSAALSSYIKKYNDVYGIDLTSFDKFSNEGKSWVLAKACDADAADVLTFKNVFYVYSSLWQVKAEPWAKIRQIVDSPENLLGVNYTYYGTLTDAEKDIVCNLLSGVLYENTQSFNEAFNEKVSEILAKRNNALNGGGGASSGGGGGVSFGTITATEPVISSKTQEIFSDISGYSWAKDSIELLYKKGIINGVGDKTFAPENFVTRAEAAKMIILAFGEVNESASCEFLDVLDGSWMYPYIATGVEKGIISGYGNKNFGTADYVTREDFATLIVRGAKAYGIELNGSGAKPAFLDSENISEYALEAVGALAENNIISGYGDGTFMPKLGATRAQAAKIIAGFLD